MKNVKTRRENATYKLRATIIQFLSKLLIHLYRCEYTSSSPSSRTDDDDDDYYIMMQTVSPLFAILSQVILVILLILLILLHGRYNLIFSVCGKISWNYNYCQSTAAVEDGKPENRLNNVTSLSAEEVNETDDGIDLCYMDVYI